MPEFISGCIRKNNEVEIIRDSLKEVTVIGHRTDQDTDQNTDQDKSPLERLLSVLGNETLSKYK